MKKYLYALIIIIGTVNVFSVVSANAQTDFIGKYRNNESNWLIEIKSNNTAIISMINDKKKKEIRFGKWKNEQKFELIVNFPAKKGAAEITCKFEIADNNTILVLEQILIGNRNSEVKGRGWFNRITFEPNPLGKYVYLQDLENKQLNQIYFDLKNNNIALYIEFNDRVPEKRIDIQGTWTWNKKKKIVTVKMPNAVTVFQIVGMNLKVLNSSATKAGTIFRKNAYTQ